MRQDRRARVRLPSAAPRAGLAYLWLDVTYTKVHQTGHVVATVVITAVTAHNRDRLKVLGMAIRTSAFEMSWTYFLRSLARRGLRDVQSVLSDDHKELKAAAQRVFQTIWRRRRVHFRSNPVAHFGHHGRRGVPPLPHTTFV